MPSREDPFESLRWERSKEGLDPDVVEMESIQPTRRQRREAKRRLRLAQLDFDIAILERDTEIGENNG